MQVGSGAFGNVYKGSVPSVYPLPLSLQWTPPRPL